MCEDVDDQNFIDKLICWSGEKGWYFHQQWNEVVDPEDPEGPLKIQFRLTLRKKEQQNQKKKNFKQALR